MKAIDFVVRNDAGAVQRAVVPAEGLETVVSLSGGLNVSLNADPADISSHVRDNSDLVLTLVDGRVIRLEGYFDADAAPNQLYLSTNGSLSDVLYVQEADGSLIVQYGQAEQWGRWSSADDLIFLGKTEIAAADGEPVDSVTQFGSGLQIDGASAAVAGAGLIGFAAAGAADGAVGSSVSSVSAFGDSDIASSMSMTASAQDAGSDGAQSPSVEDAGTPPALEVSAGLGSLGDSFDAASYEEGIVISGIGTPGAEVTVNVQNAPRTAIVDEHGDWSVAWEAGALSEGDYRSDVTVTATGGNGASITVSDTLVVDTISLGDSTDDQVAQPASEAAGSDLQVTGFAEPDATVTLSLAGAEASAVADAGGNWSATFSAVDIPAGTYDATLAATAIDVAGNSRTITQAVTVDTEAGVMMTDAPGAPDGVIAADGAVDGVMLSGTADPGAIVSVTMASVSHEVVTQPGGTWQAFFASSEVAPGVYTAAITATTIDATGNSATVSDAFEVDTRVESLTMASDAAADDAAQTVEASEGITLSGQVEPGSAIDVVFQGGGYQGDVDDAGNWSLVIPASDIEAGQYTGEVLVTATDLAGNTESLSSTVQIDTAAPEGPVIESMQSDTGLMQDVSNQQGDDGQSASGLGNYTVEAVDLQSAEDSSLTIMDAQLLNMGDGADSGVLATPKSASVVGQTYDSHMLGDSAVMIDEDLQVGGVV